MTFNITCVGIRLLLELPDLNGIIVKQVFGWCWSLVYSCDWLDSLEHLDA
jgi:hypothetical protein